MPQLRERASGDAASRRSPYADGFARIFGIETEYGVSVTGADTPCGSAETAAAMFRPVISRSRSSNTYLANGARLYLDVGSHPEYATAEARDPRTAMIQDAAGESLMRRLAMQAQTYLRGIHGPRLLVHLYKNNVDSAGHAFGCHENYLVRRQVSLDMVERQLLPFLITRQLISGAGRVDRGGFQISQRAAFLDEAISSSTTRDRPMVNTRDEPHADPDQFRRLHVIIGDSNRSQFVTRIKLALTHLVLCVIEESQRQGIASGFESCALADPSAANRAISVDMSRSTARLAMEDQAGFARDCQRYAGENRSGHDDGSQSDGPTALGLQYYYHRVVSRFVERYGARIDEDTPGFDAQQTCRVWGTLLDALASGDSAALSRQLDWAAKYRVLRGLLQRESAAHLGARERLDLDYHDIANGVVYDSLLRHGLMREEVDESRVEQALREPPSDTRAVLRGAFIASALAAGIPFSCDWTHLALGAHDGVEHRVEAVLLEPFATSGGADYERLMRACARR
ncbi:proteasome accessory factor PafA2 family protein [Bifidobacterium mongoliense]|uniref:proteasome accessory factor PafA2 family protein n=2 Tax=Bifidobacterium mongoliense TaxID=518643 RepID=UPI00264A3902|nr:proteasome accessory factor PafA2 family protein [Bifidobacterium mongoliense]MDN6025028.1 proteasome accessory factor PafA2 family protein [Bifidobacterium mongoliense]MDN6719772.1 proteasome accessory factor PafA2 family protein [Bifidobacterium mongoliense]